MLTETTTLAPEGAGGTVGAGARAVGPGTASRPAPPVLASGARSLLLNASMEPLCIVSLRRAVLLVMSGKATVLETDGRLLHSEHAAVPLPVVLCLTRYVHVPVRKPVPPTRRTVLQRDSHRCAYCGGGADTVDHVHPRSRGGRHEWGNVVAACVRCNHRKADRLLHEIGWELTFTPRAPRWSVTFGSAAVRAEPLWAAYVRA